MALTLRIVGSLANRNLDPVDYFRVARHPTATWSRSFRPTYGHSFGRAKSRVAFVAGQPDQTTSWRRRLTDSPPKCVDRRKTTEKTRYRNAAKSSLWREAGEPRPV